MIGTHCNLDYIDMKKKKLKKHELILAELKRKLKANHLYCEINDDITANYYMTGSNRVLIEMIQFIEEKL
jgi:hypothetical protein